MRCKTVAGGVLVLAVLIVGALCIHYKNFIYSFAVPERAYYTDRGAVRLYRAIFGDKNMYAHYVDAASRMSVLEAHQVMHEVGDVLYEAHGIRALALCDNSFHSGCVHQVIGREIKTNGTAGFDALKNNCEKIFPDDPGACAHGIGHGLTFSYAYNPDKLNDALAECVRLHQRDPMIEPGQSCYTGVFMEFNMHFMEQLTGAPRTYDPAHPLYPCTGLTDPFFRSMCVYWLPPWAHGEFSDSAYTAPAMEKLAELCDTVTSPNEHFWCVMGIGREIGLALPKPKNIEYLCSHATRSAEDKVTCMIRAAGVHRFYKHDTAAKETCALTQEHAHECNTFESPIPNPLYTAS